MQPSHSWKQSQGHSDEFGWVEWFPPLGNSADILSMATLSPDLDIKIPKPTKEDKSFFASLVPKDPRVTTRLVFGNDAAFVNGNMFFGIYGKDTFVRLPEGDGNALLKEKGSGPFEPMAGHPMKGYYTVPRAWRTTPEASAWVSRSLRFAASLPAKKPKSRGGK
jgi:TfoX/Sxy family transcriptional regulator of competence genes